MEYPVSSKNEDGDVPSSSASSVMDPAIRNPIATNGSDAGNSRFLKPGPCDENSSNEPPTIHCSDR